MIVPDCDAGTGDVAEIFSDIERGESYYQIFIFYFLNTCF